VKIAIIGSGISGLTAAYVLNKHHEICLYESDTRIGGHTATKQIHLNTKEYNIDTGFIVFNDWTYPNFIKLLNELGVESQETTMGFSVFDPAKNFEYSGTNIMTLFAQKRNLFSISHWQMLRDIVRFNRESLQDLASPDFNHEENIGTYLKRKKYSAAFIERYLIPMGSAIWSATQDSMLEFPLAFFVSFFKNHGLLNVLDRPQWRVIKGGSKNYIEPLISSFKSQIRLNHSIESILRTTAGVSITTKGTTLHYDQVIFACHSDQALALLADASREEQKILGAIEFQKNTVALHTDTRLLPRKKSTWCSWNYQLQSNLNAAPILTYSMNILQGIKSETEFCVTLNAAEQIDPQKILGEYEYSHPIFSHKAIQAQKDWQLINGVNRTWFCGAYWFNGFHEDGVNSALRVTNALGVVW
jgi:uncharacterized protein